MAHSHPRPYQPLLLRIVHNTSGFLTLAAILTAFWTYDTYDARWGKSPLPRLEEMEGIHGTFGLFVLLFFPIFVRYAFQRGQHRLYPTNGRPMGTPLGWSFWHRFINTYLLCALTFALFSGKMMDSQWLPQGELDHAWYYAHLLSWLLVVLGLIGHILLGFKVGGKALMGSMLRWRFRRVDHPNRWWVHCQTWWQRQPQPRWHCWAWLTPLYPLEASLLMTLGMAWLLPLVK